MLDLRRLRVLREVADRGSLAAAAAALNFTPSAISQQVAALERELGLGLIERNGRGIALTDAAQILARHAEDVLARLELAEAAMAGLRGVVEGTLRLAAFPTAAATLLPPTLTQLANRHPNLTVTLEEREPDTSLPQLKSGQLDLALIYQYDLLPQQTRAGIETEPLFTDPLRLALPRNHPASANDVLQLADLAHECWASGYPGGACTEVLQRTCNSVGFEPSIRYRSNDFHVILNLVAAGLSVAIVPALAPPDDERVVLKQFEPHLSRRILAAFRAGSRQHPNHTATLAILQTVAAEHQRRSAPSKTASPSTARAAKIHDSSPHAHEADVRLESRAGMHGF